MKNWRERKTFGAWVSVIEVRLHGHRSDDGSDEVVFHLSGPQINRSGVVILTGAVKLMVDLREMSPEDLLDFTPVFWMRLGPDNAPVITSIPEDVSPEEITTVPAQILPCRTLWT